MILPPLDAWTYDTLLDVVDRAAFEPGGFDFKEVLHATKGDENRHNLNIARAACAFANTDGGFLIFGVADPQRGEQNPRAGIAGIPLREDLRKELGHKLAVVQRPVRFDTLLRPIPLHREFHVQRLNRQLADIDSHAHVLDGLLTAQFGPLTMDEA